jgi:hypothetical protein
LMLKLIAARKWRIGYEQNRLKLCNDKKQRSNLCYGKLSTKNRSLKKSASSSNE